MGKTQKARTTQASYSEINVPYFLAVDQPLRAVCQQAEVHFPHSGVAELLAPNSSEEVMKSLREWAVGIDEDTMKELAKFVDTAPVLPEPPRPTPPDLPADISVQETLAIYQGFISSFQYNFTGVWSYFNINKRRPLSRIMDTAKGIIREALPIKCLEAVFLGLYLTSDLEQVDRIPISFKSRAGANTYRHIVLGVRYGGRFGAIGLSRKSTLMYKPLEFNSLSELIREFKDCYEACYHEVVKVKVGLPVSHDPFSHGRICWNGCQVNIKNMSWSMAYSQLDNHIATLGKNMSLWRSKYDIPSDTKSRSSIAFQKQIESLFRKESDQRLNGSFGGLPLSPRSLGPKSPRSPARASPRSVRAATPPSSRKQRRSKDGVNKEVKDEDGVDGMVITAAAIPSSAQDGEDGGAPLPSEPGNEVTDQIDAPT